jgi:hypothetical protein
MSKTMQCRSVGPISVPGCTEEDLASLRSAVSKDGSKIKYVILSAAPNDDEPGSYRFCAQAFEKLSPVAWMRQLGIAAAEMDGERHEAIKGCILPSDNIGEAIEACRVSSSSCAAEEFGVMPPATATTASSTKSAKPAKPAKPATATATTASSTKPGMTDASTQTDNVHAINSESADFDAATTGKASKRKRCPTYHQYGDLTSTVSPEMNSILDQMEAHPSCSQFWTYVHPKRACQELLLAKMEQFRK